LPPAPSVGVNYPVALRGTKAIVLRPTSGAARRRRHGRRGRQAARTRTALPDRRAASTRAAGTKAGRRRCRRPAPRTQLPRPAARSGRTAVAASRAGPPGRPRPMRRRQRSARARRRAAARRSMQRRRHRSRAMTTTADGDAGEAGEPDDRRRGGWAAGPTRRNVMTGDAGAGERDLAWAARHLASCASRTSREVSCRGRTAARGRPGTCPGRRNGAPGGRLAPAKMETGTGERSRRAVVRQTVIERETGAACFVDAAAGSGRHRGRSARADADAGGGAWRVRDGDAVKRKDANGGRTRGSGEHPTPQRGIVRRCRLPKVLPRAGDPPGGGSAAIPALPQSCALSGDRRQTPRRNGAGRREVLEVIARGRSLCPAATPEDGPTRSAPKEHRRILPCCQRQGHRGRHRRGHRPPPRTWSVSCLSDPDPVGCGHRDQASGRRGFRPQETMCFRRSTQCLRGSDTPATRVLTRKRSLEGGFGAGKRRRWSARSARFARCHRVSR